MKLRIKGPSIRLRLTQSEVATFQADGRFSHTTPAPGGRLHYVLQRVAGRDRMGCQMAITGPADVTLTLEVPEPLATQWTGTNEVGMRGEVQLPDGTITTLLVEKDFACLDNTEEDQSDNYPNPHATC